jgi:uncharacterized membrane protein (TIGR02234 family)
VRSRRGLTTAVLLCLVGAFVVLVAAGRAWVSVEVPAGPLAAARTDSHTGTDIVPGLSALGLVGLAGVVALAATRRTGRVLVGLVLLATGAGVVAAVLDAYGTPLAEKLPGQPSDAVAHLTVWSSVTAVGGVLLIAAGVLTVLRGRSWSALGQRYEAPAGTAATAATPLQPTEQSTDKALWEALDRGEDPTASLGSLARPPADREADRT